VFLIWLSAVYCCSRRSSSVFIAYGDRDYNQFFGQRWWGLTGNILLKRSFGVGCRYELDVKSHVRRSSAVFIGCNRNQPSYYRFKLQEYGQNTPVSFVVFPPKGIGTTRGRSQAISFRGRTFRHWVFIKRESKLASSTTNQGCRELSDFSSYRVSCL
jgi:hypothetical protein